jgi:hypothetical protein
MKAEFDSQSPERNSVVVKNDNCEAGAVNLIRIHRIFTNNLHFDLLSVDPDCKYWCFCKERSLGVVLHWIPNRFVDFKRNCEVNLLRQTIIRYDSSTRGIRRTIYFGSRHNLSASHNLSLQTSQAS